MKNKIIKINKSGNKIKANNIYTHKYIMHTWWIPNTLMVASSSSPFAYETNSIKYLRFFINTFIELLNCREIKCEIKYKFRKIKLYVNWFLSLILRNKNI